MKLYLVIAVISVACLSFSWGSSLKPKATDAMVAQLGLPANIDRKLLQEFLDLGPEIREWIWSFGDSNPLHRRPAGLICPICATGLQMALAIFSSDETPEDMISAVVSICTMFGIANRGVCEGAVNLYFPSLYFIHKEKPWLTHHDFCGVIMQCGRENATLSDWDINLDAPPSPAPGPAPPLPARPSYAQILQLTDIHLDLHYVEGTHAACDGYLCCRDDTPLPDPSLPPEDHAGHYGGVGCDFPKAGLEDLFQDPTGRGPFEFVMLTGDYVHHAVWKTTPEDNMAHNDHVLSTLFAKYPSTPVYPTIGNHEAHPCNMYPTRDLYSQGPDFDLQWMYDSIANHFEDAKRLTPEAIRTLREGGYYTLVHKPGLRIVALNNNRCYTNNFWLLHNTVDPEGQLQWFADVMKMAEDQGEKVYVLGHVPPGKDCWSTWSRKLTSILNRYKDTIQGQFYGHTHNDEVRVFYDGPWEAGKPLPKPTSVLYIGASATTYTHLNPGYKVYDVDGAANDPTVDTWEIVNHHTYYYDIHEANNIGGGGPLAPRWQKLPDAKTDFGLADMRAESYHAMLEEMAKDDTNALFQNYYTHWTKNSTTHEPCDTQECKMTMLCEIVATDVADESHCEYLKSLVGSK